MCRAGAIAAVARRAASRRGCVGVFGSVGLGRNTGSLSKPYFFLLVHRVS